MFVRESRADSDQAAPGLDPGPTGREGGRVAEIKGRREREGERDGPGRREGEREGDDGVWERGTDREGGRDEVAGRDLCMPSL